MNATSLTLGLLCLFSAVHGHIAAAENNTELSSQVITAEHVRLSEEMRSLSQRQVWKGVEAKYLDIESLGAIPTFTDYLQGAHAARSLGKISEARTRLWEASRIEPTKEILDWLSDIDNHYGQVSLMGDGTGEGELAPLMMPFDPVQRSVVESAMASVVGQNTFIGVLPLGDYTYGSAAFSVAPGETVEVELECRKHCRNR